jgi:hypothetical protein
MPAASAPRNRIFGSEENEMNKTRFKLAAAFAALALLALACGFNVSTANFSNAFMAADPDGNQPTTVYAPEDPFYAIVDLANAPDDTTVRAVWTAVNVEGEAPDTLIDETSITSGDARLTFDLTNAVDMIWPTGTYRVDLYLNDELKESLSFSVQ